jgi:hypothetical protein
MQFACVCSVAELHWQTRVSELEERVLQQNQDLDSHVHVITLLEAEKLEHMQSECETYLLKVKSASWREECCMYVFHPNNV